LEEFLERVEVDLEQRKRNLKELKREVRREREEKIWASETMPPSPSRPSFPAKKYRGNSIKKGSYRRSKDPVLAFMGRMERDLYERKQASPEKFVPPEMVHKPKSSVAPFSP
jgi:hypothetical protein